MAEAGSPRELESLVTRLYMDVGDFTAKTEQVLSTIDSLEKRFSLMGDNLQKAATAINANVTAASSGLGESLKALSNTDSITKNAENASTAIGRLMSYMDKSVAQGSALPKFHTAMDNLGMSIGELSENAVPLSKLKTNLEEFVKAIGPMATTLGTEGKTFARSLGGIGKFVEATSVVDDSFRVKLRQVAGGLRSFGETFGQFAGAVATGDVTSASQNLSRVGTFLAAAGRFKYDPQMFSGLSEGVKGLFTSLSGGAALSGVKEGSNSLSKMASFFRAAGNVTPAHIGSLKDSVHGLFQSFNTKDLKLYNASGAAQTFMRFGTGAQKLAGVEPQRIRDTTAAIADSLRGLNEIPLDFKADKTARFANTIGRFGTAVKNISSVSSATPDALVRMVGAVGVAIQGLNAIEVGPGAGAAASVLYRLGTAMSSLSKVGTLNPSYLANSAKAMRQMLTIVDSVPVSTNAVRAANVLHRLGQTARAFSQAGGTPPPSGGSGGGWFGWLRGGLASIPPAANNAKTALDGMGDGVRSLNATSSILGSTLFGIRMSLMGIAGFGAKAFAESEAALLRAGAHAGDFGRQDFDQLRRGTMLISAKSTSSTLDLSRSLDRLMASGMSATAALKSLSIAEDFAVSSGMNVTESTKRLVDLQHSMGLANQGPEQYRKTMTEISDLLVGVAAASGSTEQQLTEAFTGRFLSATRAAKMDVKDAIALMGGLSRAGEGYRGMKGGNVAARGIEHMIISGTGEQRQWVEMLGQSAFDAKGQVKPLFDLLVLMSDKMGEPGTAGFIANLSQLKFKNVETFNAIEPLLHVAHAAKEIRDRMDEMNGVSARTADTVRTGLLSQMTMLWNSFSGAASVVGERLAPALYALTAPIAGLLTSFTQLDPALQNLIVWGGVSLVAIAPVISGLKGVGAAVAYLASPLMAIGSAVYTYAIAPLASLAGMAAVGLVKAVSVGVVAVYSGFVPAMKAVGSWGYAACQAVFDFGKSTYRLSSWIMASIPNVLRLAGNLAFVGLVAGYTAARGLYEMAASVGSAVGSMVASVAWAAGRLWAISLYTPIEYAFKAIGRFLHFLLTVEGWAVPLYDVLESVAKATYDVGKAMVVAASNLAISAFTGLTSVLFNLIPLMLGAAVAWIALPSILAAVAAPVITIGIGLYQLGGLIGGALVHAWNNFGNAAHAALDWAAGSVRAIGQNVSWMWEAIQTSGLAAMTSLMNAISSIAGFFWNVRKNLATLLDWVGENGDEPFHDLLDAAGSFLRILGNNAGLLFGALANTATKTLSAVWTTLGLGAGAVFKFVADQWQFAIHDMGVVFQLFLSNLVDNFSVVNKAINRIAAVSRHEFLMSSVFTGKVPEATAKWAAEERAKAFATMSSEMKGPLAGLDDIPERTWKFDRDFISLKSNLKTAYGEMGPVWGAAGKDIAKGFGAAFMGMKPFANAFTAISESEQWQELFGRLDFTTPSTKEAADFMKKVLDPITGKGGMGESVGQGGPGFSLKQSSMNRFMFDGAVNERIDYQQLVVMQQIRNYAQIIAEQRGIHAVESTRVNTTNVIRTMPRLEP